MITIRIKAAASIEKVWQYWTDPNDITKWNNASSDWHCPKAENDLKIGGKFSYTMASKDGMMSFDFEGIYTNVIEYSVIEYKISDGRKVKVTFVATKNAVEITESFEPENQNPIEMQRQGWQNILDNFKEYTESN